MPMTIFLKKIMNRKKIIEKSSILEIIHILNVITTSFINHSYISI